MVREAGDREAGEAGGRQDSAFELFFSVFFCLVVYFVLIFLLFSLKAPFFFFFGYITLSHQQGHQPTTTKDT